MTDEERWQTAVAKLPARTQRLLNLAYEEGCHKCGSRSCVMSAYSDDAGVEWNECGSCAMEAQYGPTPWSAVLRLAQDEDEASMRRGDG